MTDIPKRFNFREVEDKWCRYWEAHQIFHGAPKAGKEAYSIVIPPPNVTGILHMGHALNNTLQDIIIRYQRMKGREACWMPGTDHAGIATQNVVEKQLAKEGKTRHDVGREKLLERLWDWKKEYGDTIINQLKKLGASCDWPRTRFTMDGDYSGAVRHVFMHLYNKGLIYQGEYIINWCPRCQTALSDEEAEHRDQQGSLYYIRYPLKAKGATDSGPKDLIVATTRPETMLGDTAVAVNPEDARYKELIGRTIVLPVVNREIPVIADAFVDPEFGTGAVKVTPAHDPNDFQMGTRHKLPIINVMHPDGRMNENAGEFTRMDRFEAREAIVDTLTDLKLLVKVEQHAHAVGHCYRCHTVVEPYLSKQWFVKMQPLAEKAIEVVKDGRVTFTPDRWTKVYMNWMENIRDWCISRQIWWGHRIPVWYDADNNIYCALTEEEARSHARKKHGTDVELRQDPDVLDTWFSSWLWPFATFGWPEKTEDLKYFYPTNALFTASEIIFFWVARMIMAGMEFMGDIPFSDVYIHGTVRDAKGIKMSKSLGNAIDPLEIIEEYGADALRFSLIINSGLDLYISKDKFEIGRNFANKIWNASRFVLMNSSIPRRHYDLEADIDAAQLDLPAQWILSRFSGTLKQVSRAIEQYRYSEAENLIYDFFWRTFCDWYLEIAKQSQGKPEIQKLIFSILEQSIRMMHPFIPFVTEEIWQNLSISDGPVSLQPWPVLHESLIKPEIEAGMQNLIEIVTSIRNLKARWNIKPLQSIECYFSAGDEESLTLLNENRDMLCYLLKIEKMDVLEDLSSIRDAATGIAGRIKFCLPLGGLIDVQQERNRMQAEIEKYKKSQDGLAARLNNDQFIRKAPTHVIDGEKDRLKDLLIKIEELEETIKGLSGQTS